MPFDSKKTAGGHTASHPEAETLSLLVAPATGKEKNTVRLALVPVGCWKLEDLRFVFDSSFVLPDARDEFDDLAKLRAAHPGSPLSIFGHADPVGNDDYNKILSGRRARAIYAVLIRDAAIWESLYKNAEGTGDVWGQVQIQHCLAALGLLTTPPSGTKSTEATAAIKSFQSANGLNPDGDAGPQTRAKLFPAYFDFLSSAKLTKADFLARGADAGGKGDFQGCSEFNPLLMFSATENQQLNQPAQLDERNRQNSTSRRVLALLFRPDAVVDPARWPCPRASESTAACVKRFFSDAATRRQFQAKRRTFEVDGDTFACRFYDRLVALSPCEKPIDPDRDLVDPLIIVPDVEEEPEPEPVAAASAPAPAQPADQDAARAGKAAAAPADKAKKPADPPVKPTLGPAKLTVVVAPPYLPKSRTPIVLKTDSVFTGTGRFSRSDTNIDFFRKGAAAALTFNGIDDVFTGADLTAGVTLEAQGVAASKKVDETTLTLTLTGGAKKNGAPAKIKATAISVVLDICEPRVKASTAPIPLPTLATAAPADPAKPADKFFLGRPLPLQGDPKFDERAMLIVRAVKPKGFKGSLELKPGKAGDKKLEIYAKEKFEKGEKPKDFPVKVPAGGVTLFVEGHEVSAAARDTTLQIGVAGFVNVADEVKVTVCHTEAVSNKKPADVKTVAKVPEKPERKTKSTFLPAPIIIGHKYDVEIRPFIELAVPSAFAWSTVSTRIKLTNPATEICGVNGDKISGALNDVELECLLTTNIGKLKKIHKLTVAKVEINPIIQGDNLKHDDDINTIRNPAGCVILAGADKSDVKLVPKYEITKITPDIKWKADDERIAWWVIGGEAKGNNKYDGKADFLNTDAGKYGTKVQVFGTTEGDVLIQPYSGGYGYGMIRSHVVAIKKVKYRLNRIFTTAQKAQAATPLVNPLPEQLPQPAFPGNGVIPKQPAVPHLVAVAGRPPQPPIPARVAGAPSSSHAEALLHIKIVNIYLRAAGIEMIPDNSAEVARPVLAARAGQPAVAAQPAVLAQVATPAVGAVVAQPAVPARPAVPALPVLPAIIASAANTKVGLPALDANVISVTRIQDGHFDVEVNTASLTIGASRADSESAIRINNRNEVISFAYIHSQPGASALATALLCPFNHAPNARANPPTVPVYVRASFKLTDLGTPSSSLKVKTGIPDNVPADPVEMFVLPADVGFQGASPAVRDSDLLWGVIVPNRSIDRSAGSNKNKIRLAYGNTLAHELGHVFGLGHRNDLADVQVGDGLGVPALENLMHPTEPPPRAQNIDIIQVKAIRFSEALFRAP